MLGSRIAADMASADRGTDRRVAEPAHVELVVLRGMREQHMDELA